LDLIGKIFAGYEVIAKIGEGGFGAVFKARQPALNRFIALKILAPHLAADAEFVARFTREATLAASLNHSNMVLVYSAGTQDQTHYIAMEFVEGETLRQRIENHGRLEPREAIAIAVYVAQALQYAWNKSSLIHRDIKPDNIFVSKAGEIKVGDLGLAKNVGQTTAGLTQTGMAMGSPHYIAPEQARGLRDIDFRADIYSLGCTLYHMLTGQPPYEGTDSMSIMMKHVNDPPPAIFKAWPQCPMPLGLLVGKMLKKNPRERQQSYEELIAELTAAHEKIAAMQAAAVAPPSGTITFLFTDIEGSTQLWEKHPQAMPGALERHNQLLRRAVESHGGFVFKTVGDAFCVAFASASNALAAALAAEPWGETGPLRVRMALHTGLAEERGGDYFGPALNRVARVLAAGHGGQILLSNATEQLVRDHLTEGVSLGDLGEHSLKNLTRAEHIYQINLPDMPTQFPTLKAARKRAGWSSRFSVLSPDGLKPELQRALFIGVPVVITLAGLLWWSPWKQSGPRPPPANPKLGDNMVTTAGIELVYIPPGEFMMGSTKEEQAWAMADGLDERYVKREGEAPRKAKIKDGFWLGRTEVTVGQWKQFVAATGYKSDAEKRDFAHCAYDRQTKTWKQNVKGASWRDPGFDQADNHPVGCVTWNDAVAFCEWLAERERRAGRLPRGCQVRLPTEAEWEYACRAGTVGKWWWGDVKEEGEGRQNWSGSAYGFEFTSPVDHYGARGRNGFGLADMLGNMQEWCLDDYDAAGAHEELYKGGGLRVLRGGTFHYGPSYARCACRIPTTPGDANSYHGFRVAVGLAR
jgi:serine/threonine-protein kinase